MSSRSIDSAVYRILDANLDRAAEGLRVAMDLVRFALDDEPGSRRLRDVRHEILSLVSSLPRLQGQRLAARDSEQDAGRELGHSAPGRPLPEVFSANIHRAQEAVRTLEEIVRGFSPEAADRLGGVRYRLYTLEKEYQPRIDAWGGRAKLDFDLYVVTSPELQRGRSLEEVVTLAIAGGAGCIQLRAKKLGKRELLREARTLRKITRDAGVTFIINDHIDIALTVEADGVHLGQDDFPIPEARRIVGPAMILGASTHSVEEALQAEREGASYINVGPVFATQTKEGVGAPVGVDLVAQVKAAVHTPQTCMGGIKLHNVREVVLAGAERIAVVSEVVGADDIAASARALVEAIREAKEGRAGVI